MSSVTERVSRVLSARAMEEDRDQVDLGIAIEAQLEAEEIPPSRQPKRRFIGKRAAAEKASAENGSDGTIEDSGAIQGEHPTKHKD